MRPALELSLGGDWLMLARQGAPRARTGIPTPVPTPTPVPADASGRMTDDALASQLDRALQQLAAAQGASMQGMALDVSLGQAHAHIGLASLGPTTGRLNQKALQECCSAWVGQMLHLDPATQLIRWQALAPANGADRNGSERSAPERSGLERRRPEQSRPDRQLLIASVSNATVQAVSDFAARHHLRLRSCRPAVLSMLDRARQLPEPLATWVWTEHGATGRRASAVQILGLRRGQLACCWRGWVPAQHDDGEPAPLLGAIARFQACHFQAYQFQACHSAARVRHLHWPLQRETETP